jgi:2-iminobutanoate/2-iminopropanoate deaminase
MQKISINPDTLYDGSSIGLSQAVIDPDSGLVFVSGQVDWDLKQEVSSDSMSVQFQGALKKLEIALTAAGASVETILQMRVFVRGELEDHMAELAPILSGFLKGSRPAITGVGVASLATKATLVEVEAIARRD